MIAVYLSGPISGTDDWRERFAAASVAVLRSGFCPINPAARGEIQGYEWADYLRDDLAMLRMADCILMLCGWERSTGARAELAAAIGMGLTVHFEAAR